MLGHLAKPPSTSDTPTIPRSAAVLVPLCLHNNVLSILFIKRTSKRGSHRGQISFPGGIFDPDDNNDPMKCAIREMNEEINLPMNAFDIIGLHHDAGTSDTSKSSNTDGIAKPVVKSTIMTPVVAMLKTDLVNFFDCKENMINTGGTTGLIGNGCNGGTDGKTYQIDFPLTPAKLSVNELDYILTIPVAQLAKLDQNWTVHRSRPAFKVKHNGLDRLLLPIEGINAEKDAISAVAQGKHHPIVTIEAGFAGIQHPGHAPRINYQMVSEDKLKAFEEGKIDTINTAPIGDDVAKPIQDQKISSAITALDRLISKHNSGTLADNLFEPLYITNPSTIPLQQIQYLSMLEASGKITIHDVSNKTTGHAHNDEANAMIIALPGVILTPHDIQRIVLKFSNENQENNNNPKHKSTQTNNSTTIPTQYIQQEDLLWGATAHITHLFLNQVLVPILDDLFPDGKM